MPQPLRIAVVGDFNPEFHSHPATNRALARAARALQLEVEVEWLATDSIVQYNPAESFRGFDGVWAAPGSPYVSMEGMLAAIRYARERNCPLVAT